MMKKPLLIAASLCFICSLSAAAAPLTVIVDTGHTDLVPGAKSPSGRREYDYNRTIAKLVVTGLRAKGYQVIDLADKGRERDLKERTAVTKPNDLFVSIHHDSIQQALIDAGRSREFKGFSIFISQKNPVFDRSLECAWNVGNALVRAGERPSLYHAQNIKGENRPLLDPTTGIHEFDGLAVLKTAMSPAILIEVGVIANPDEEDRLASPAFTERASAAIVDGISVCFK